MKTSSISSSHLVLGGLVALTLCTGAILTSSRVTANDTVVDDISITVPASCSMGGEIATGQEHSASLQNGIWSGDNDDYADGIGKTTITTFCNDYNGFSIYAVGFTGDVIDSGDNNKLIGVNTGFEIDTGVYEQGDTESSWSMKVTKVTDPSETDTPANMEITNSFNSWHTVPATYTQVAQYKAETGSSATIAETDGGLGAKVETTYAAYISQTQAADQYTGKVKYIMVHPYDNLPFEDDGYRYVYHSPEEEWSFEPENLEVVSYQISDSCMTMDSWVVNDLTPEQREIFCNGGEVIMDEGTEHEYVYSAQSIIDEGDWLEVQMGTDFFKSVKIADQPDAVTDYTILNSDVFIKYNKDNFLENYICTMYNAAERNGEPYCFSSDDNAVESIVSLFGEENCIDGGGTQCNAIDDEELWSCEIFDSIASCYASKNGGNYGAMLESNIYYDFPEPYEQYDELVFYNGEPLSIYSNATWNEITPDCMFRCLNDVGPDEYLTPTRYYSLSFDATSENSAHVDLTLYDSSDLTIETSVAIQTDPETGDSWVVVGDPDYGICSVKSNGFDYTQFTFQGAPLSSVDKIQEVVEEYACQNFNMQFEVLDTECIKKLIGEPQVTTLQEI